MIELGVTGDAQAPVGPPPDLKAFPATSDHPTGEFTSTGMMQLPPASAAATAAASGYRRKPNFAEKLHALLCKGECCDAVAWLPSGNSFCVLDRNEFAKKILPAYFSGGKFDSFCRRLKRWGFRKVYADDRGRAVVYSHGLFRRDAPGLCKMMNGVVKSPVAVSRHDEIVVAGGMPSVGGGDFNTCVSQGSSFSNAVAFQRQQDPDIRHWMDGRQATASESPRERVRGCHSPISQRGSVLSARNASCMNHQQAAATSGPSQEQVRGAGSPISLQGSVLSARTFSSLPPESVNNVTPANIVIVNAHAASDARAAPNPAMPHHQGGLDFPRVARMQLARLSDGIADCDKQMAVLERMKAEMMGKPAPLLSSSIRDLNLPDDAIGQLAGAAVARSVPNNARSCHEQDRRGMMLHHQDPGVVDCYRDYYPHSSQDTQIIDAQKTQLNRLNDDIVNCEEQLVILQRMKELQEQKHQLRRAGGGSSGSFSRV